MDRINHGGQVFTKENLIDFSVSLNPLGIPRNVRNCLAIHIDDFSNYPELGSTSLRKQIASSLTRESLYNIKFTSSNILCGNGASELILAVLKAVSGKKVLVAAPHFSGYTYAINCAGCEEVRYELPFPSLDFSYEFLDSIKKDLGLIILTNPNNPTGLLINQYLLKDIASKAQRYNIPVLIDECFLELVSNGNDYSFIDFLEEYKNVIVLRAFTKTYALAGIRLGYIITFNQKLLAQIKTSIPEWSVSTVAQLAGKACLNNRSYLKESLLFLEMQRQYMITELRFMFPKVWEGKSNFIFFTSFKPIHEKLRKEGILLRNCSDMIQHDNLYFYRLGIRKPEDNRLLLQYLEIYSR